MTSGLEKQAILAADLEHVWHPMTQHSLLAGKPPMLVVEAFGSTVVDADGKPYIDTMAGLWCVTAGYGQTAIADRVYRQMKTLPYYPHTAANVPAAELARELGNCLGGDLKRIYFTCSGSEANDAAFKLARQFGRLARPAENRYKIIARHRAYHGTTMGALSATGQSERKWRFEPLVPGFLHAAPAYCYRCAFGKSYPACELECAAQVETMILHEGPETVAAMIIEPVVGGGGILVPVEEYLPAVREITRRYGVLLISDEVISGFGRTGKMFGFQTYGIDPDIVTMAKGLTSAYLPLGAVATTGAIFSAFLGELEDRVHLVQVNTFGGHPVACAAGLANLELLAEQRLVDRAAEAGRRFLDALKDLERYSLVGEVRGKGMIFGIELVADKKTRAPASPAIISRVVARAMEQGVILGKTTMTTFHLNNVITLSPPLVITSEELDKVLAVLHATLKDA